MVEVLRHVAIGDWLYTWYKIIGMTWPINFGSIQPICQIFQKVDQRENKKLLQASS